eukprot:8601011-Pyramimonas_sp.AAC.1
MGQCPKAGELLAIGAWPAADAVRLWDQLPTHRDSWPLVLVFNGRVLTRFSRRVCRDGALVSREVPGFTDIDKAVTLATVDDWPDVNRKLASWSLVFSQEWTSYEVNFDDNSMLGWIHADETVTLRPDFRHWSDRADAFIQSVPWDDDGRFLCAGLHWVRTGFG